MVDLAVVVLEKDEMFLCGLDCCVDVCRNVDGEVEAWDQFGIDER